MLFLTIDLILACAATILTCCFGGILSSGWDFYLPILLLIAYFLLAIAFTFLMLFLIAAPVRRKEEFYSKQSRFYRFVMEHGFSYLCALGRVRIHFEGKEKIPDRRFVLICNHLSKFDPMSISACLKGYRLSWIAKKELFRMPLISNYMYKSNYLTLDRDDLRQSLRAISQAADYIEKDICSVGVFPEGTRNKGNDLLLPLKAGSFKIALLAKTDIVVVAIAHSEQIAKRFPFRSTNIYIRVGEVIPYADIQNLSSQEIAKKATEIMKTHIEELRKKKI